MRYTIGKNAKLFIFNDIKTVIDRLSNVGLGKICEWAKKGFYYSSHTELHYFDTSKNGLTQNAISFLLCGEQDSIHLLSISLSIGFNQNKEIALQTFLEYVNNTLTSIDIHIYEEMRQSILSRKSYSENNGSYDIDFEYTDHENMTDCYLNVKSKLYDYSDDECVGYTLLS